MNNKINFDSCAKKVEYKKPVVVKLSPNKNSKIILDHKPFSESNQFKELKMTDLGVYIDQPLNIKNLESISNFNLNNEDPYMVAYSNSAFVPMMNSITLK